MSTLQSLTAFALLTSLSAGAEPKTSPQQNNLSKANAPQSAPSRLDGLKEHEHQLSQRVATSPMLKRLSYLKHNDGSFEINLPIDLSIQKAGELLNKEAKSLGLENPVFDESHSVLWKQNELIIRFRTDPGKTYHLKIPENSINKTKIEQISEFGELQPMGALALAEACEALQSRQSNSLLKVNNVPVIVRTSHDIFAIRSSGSKGVRPCLISETPDNTRGADKGQRRHPIIAAVVIGNQNSAAAPLK